VGVVVVVVLIFAVLRVLVLVVFTMLVVFAFGVPLGLYLVQLAVSARGQDKQLCGITQQLDCVRNSLALGRIRRRVFEADDTFGSICSSSSSMARLIEAKPCTCADCCAIAGVEHAIASETRADFMNISVFQSSRFRNVIT
jgi:hypothetical protein